MKNQEPISFLYSIIGGLHKQTESYPCNIGIITFFCISWGTILFYSISLLSICWKRSWECSQTWLKCYSNKIISMGLDSTIQGLLNGVLDANIYGQFMSLHSNCHLPMLIFFSIALMIWLWTTESLKVLLKCQSYLHYQGLFDWENYLC